VIDTIPRVFTDAQLAILGSFASLVVDELELRRIAEADHLSGALSRRGLIGQIEKQIERFSEDGPGNVFALFDIDHFKAVDDTFGHAAGDAVLKTIGATCAALLGAHDAFGRLGGEEFGILLSRTSVAESRSATENFRQSIDLQRTPGAEGVHVTASFGLAALGPSIRTPEQWLAEADEALYRAKRSGRNRCIFAASSLRSAAV
jgi:diguanylate cyclase (GGDEF)-like protein